MAYITYLPHPDRHTNAANSHAGFGATPQASQDAALYWANQLPWIRTVPLSAAPRWAVEEARASYHQACLACGKVHPPEHRGRVCVDSQGYVLPHAREWPEEVTIYEF